MSPRLTVLLLALSGCDFAFAPANLTNDENLRREYADLEAGTFDVWEPRAKVHFRGDSVAVVAVTAEVSRIDLYSPAQGSPRLSITVANEELGRLREGSPTKALTADFEDAKGRPRYCNKGKLVPVTDGRGHLQVVFSLACYIIGLSLQDKMVIDGGFRT